MRRSIEMTEYSWAILTERVRAALVVLVGLSSVYCDGSASSGSGGSGGMGGSGGSVAAPGSGGSAEVTCTARNFADVCPQRPCETLTGCESRTCQYTPIICGNQAQQCPREVCMATELTGGRYRNECQVAPNHGCESDELCRNNLCTPWNLGLRIESDRFNVGEAYQEPPSDPGSSLRLTGQVGLPSVDTGYSVGSSGTLRLSKEFVQVR